MLPVDPARLALFVGTMSAFAVTPGPANLFSIATGARGGPRAALLGVAGMNAANLVWLTAAGLGLGALIAAFPAAFRVLGVLGAAYIAFLGAKSLWSAWREAPADFETGRGASVGHALRDGFIVQITNPKAVVFYTAVLPPFIDPTRAAWPQVVWFGAAILLCDVIAMGAYGLAGGALARTLQKGAARRWFAGVVGVLLLVTAVLIVLRR